MANRVKTVRTDELDGSSVAETVKFGIDGKAYEIDLGPANLARMQKVLQPFIDAGRRVKRSRLPRTASARREAAAIRAWAIDQGLKVAARGRMSAEVVSKYKAAH